MNKTPIDHEIVNSKIKQSGLSSVGKASIREIKKLIDTIEEEAGQKYIRMEMGIPGLSPVQIGVDAEIQALKNGVASIYPDIYGIQPEIDFSDTKRLKEEQAGKSMWDEFIWDIFMKALPTLVFIALLGITIIWIFDMVGFLNLAILSPIYANMWLVWAAGFYIIGFMSIIKTRYMYKSGFEDKMVLDLVTNVKVSPIRTIPAFIEGKIVGKGIPGYYFHSRNRP